MNLFTSRVFSAAVRKSTRGKKAATSTKAEQEEEEEEGDEEPPASPLRPPSLINTEEVAAEKQVNANTAPGGQEVDGSLEAAEETEGSTRANIKGKNNYRNKSKISSVISAARMLLLTLLGVCFSFQLRVKRGGKSLSPEPNELVLRRHASLKTSSCHRTDPTTLWVSRTSPTRRPRLTFELCCSHEDDAL